VNAHLENNCENLKYVYHINFTQALSKTKGVIALLWKKIPTQSQKIWQKILPCL